MPYYILLALSAFTIFIVFSIGGLNPTIYFIFMIICCLLMLFHYRNYESTKNIDTYEDIDDSDEDEYSDEEKDSSDENIVKTKYKRKRENNENESLSTNKKYKEKKIEFEKNISTTVDDFNKRLKVIEDYIKGTPPMETKI